MGLHLSVRVAYGAIFTEEELKNSTLGRKIMWMDESEHPHIAYGSEEDGRVHYMWVKGTHQTVASNGGGFVDERHVAPMDSFKKGDEAAHRRNFQFSCEELGLPPKEPTWLLLWGWS